MRIPLTLAALLLAAPAFAQQSPVNLPPAPAQNYQATSEMLLRQALSCEQVATQQIAALSKQVADLTKERDDLKAAKSEPATEKPHQ